VEVVSLDWLLFIEHQFAHISILFTFLYSLLFFAFDKSFGFFFFFGFPLFEGFFWVFLCSN
jgi:hypothetical protein